MESWAGRPGIRPRCCSAVRLVESCRPPPRGAGPAHAARQNDAERGHAITLHQSPIQASTLVQILSAATTSLGAAQRNRMRGTPGYGPGHPKGEVSFRCKYFKRSLHTQRTLNTHKPRIQRGKPEHG